MQYVNLLRSFVHHSPVWKFGSWRLSYSVHTLLSSCFPLQSSLDGLFMCAVSFAPLRAVSMLFIFFFYFYGTIHGLTPCVPPLSATLNACCCCWFCLDNVNYKLALAHEAPGIYCYKIKSYLAVAADFQPSQNSSGWRSRNETF